MRMEAQEDERSKQYFLEISLRFWQARTLPYSACGLVSQPAHCCHQPSLKAGTLGYQEAAVAPAP